ncbi:MAG: ABC transporter ATP-binding protein [Armatimonadota bacterium]|nr:ABC transporter ATP-binding protein [Armatimonadota bacterium]MDR7450708.1 ABC transporter ATP-binding protein [Armatimonadota bacterium]MDR7466064.1 ABC transporter ATP-binding protein [Armatimonadota bacterium]MDR7493899.1 ABC transporter ATP-binding protein [Armatimonadota bacterium]MDR7504004.1 ABC transporter ATP-binding protein [Armatimonadota bacterium]
MPLLEVERLEKHYPLHGGLLGSLVGARRLVHAVNGISFALDEGASLGLAGESGCGKTTTARLILRLLRPTGGVIRFAGRDIAGLNGAELLAFRRRVQFVFQNPYEALNPRFTVLRAMLEPLIIHGIGTSAGDRLVRVAEALRQVHLNPPEAFFAKFPHQLSGGQLQRVVIARALLVGPALLVADEPVSMLDVSVRAGVLNLMRDLTRRRGLTTLYISHDLALIRYMCTTTAVMYLGTICEIGPTTEVIERPKHPYTQALVAAVPDADPNRPVAAVEIREGVPTPLRLPPGCPFADRCPQVMEVCRRLRPQLQPVEGVRVACHLYGGAH